jgi:hypothetical protein
MADRIVYALTPRDHYIGRASAGDNLDRLLRRICPPLMEKDAFKSNYFNEGASPAIAS